LRIALIEAWSGFHVLHNMTTGVSMDGSTSSRLNGVGTKTPTAANSEGETCAVEANDVQDFARQDNWRVRGWFLLPWPIQISVSSSTPLIPDLPSPGLVFAQPKDLNK
jgi:hypothetical protein